MLRIVENPPKYPLLIASRKNIIWEKPEMEK